MSESNGGKAPSLLTGTLKLAAVIGLCGYGAATWLSQGGLERGRFERLAAVLKGDQDPVTTGAIGPAAHTFRLDPCVVPRR